MELTAQIRDKFGKSVKALREKGLIPAELYGRGLDNMHLAIDSREFRKLFKEAGSNTVINIVVGAEKRKAIIHGVQHDSVSDAVRHIDFYQVRMDEEITAKVPVEFTGEAPAVKEQGGILNKTMTEIEVKALPGDLPHNLPVDLSVLTELNQSIYVKDLALPKGVKVEVDAETVIVTVAPPLAEEVAPVAPVDVSAVKVESEEKKAEREKEKSAEEKA